MIENFLSQGGISLDRLKSFCLVAEKGGISRACNGDPSRQALISRQIKELEVFFGTELIRRKGKGIELTAAGVELARQVHLQFRGMSDFKAACSALPIDFRIAAGNSILEWLLVPCMPRIAEYVSACTYELLDWRTGDIVRGLLDHTVDFGIVRKSAITKPLKFHPLGRFGYSLFVPKQLTTKKQTVSDLPLAISVGGEFLRDFQAATIKAGFQPNIVYRCTSFTQAAHLARLGVAAAVLPDIAGSTVASFAPPVSVPWLKSFHRDLGVGWHARLVEIRPRAGELLDVLQSLLKEPFMAETRKS
ncbi:MAG: LysR family transcriptional regulator [Terrimicrobiaceae bacterium]|jgi:DNA-binding transcriptional LysR family regulator|nr:LysR family transcriptional regulator [Terrimicrobiaceae bacterium]